MRTFYETDIRKRTLVVGLALTAWFMLVLVRLVDLQALRHPGFTATELFEKGGQALNWMGRTSLMPSRRVARIGLRALFKGRPHVVAGGMNALVAFLTRFLPRQTCAAVAEKLV